MNYLKQLDAIRAIAVILVIASHWLDFVDVLQILSIGKIGLDIFFVLSGFLITRILLEHRQKAETFNLSYGIVLKNFYVRRALRIFPIYYLTIFALLFVSDRTGTGIKPAFLYFLTYTSNFYFYNRQEWDGIISHLWSLAVEEQFYLIWPWLMLFVNKKYLIHTIVSFILIGIGSQYLLRDYPFYEVVTITCFDCFGLGALLAWLVIHRPEQVRKAYRWMAIAAVFGFFNYCLFVYEHALPIIPFRTCIALIALWVIAYINRNTMNEKIKFGFILNNEILLFLGRISYGLYIYHNLLPKFINSNFIRTRLNAHLPDALLVYERPIVLIESTILLVVIAWLSYEMIEKPFLQLKKYFDYEQTGTQQALGNT